MKVINGVILEGFMEGWNDKESNQIPVPFDIESYLDNGNAEIVLANGKRNKVSYHRSDGLFEFAYGNTRIKRPMKLYREWRNESLDMIMWLESVAIGECTRKVINGEKILDD